MGRAYPRFLLSKSTQAKSKGTFIIHTLDPVFIAEPAFNEIRQIIDVHVVEVYQQGTFYFDKATQIADKEIPTWWKYSGIHDSCEPADKIISKLQKLDFLKRKESDYSIEEAQEVIKIVFPNKANAYNKNITSYGLKHCLERISQLFISENINKYCSNNTLKHALKLQGFKTKEDGPGSPNVIANISEKDLNIIEPIGFYRINNFGTTESF